ncbi:MAG: PaaI family thioesterase [Dehalococcoidia bacterium]|nr:PaaI family thioesterase [Dehalococcoidia bacterium]
MTNDSPPADDRPYSTWVPDGAPPPREAAARRRLANALRRTIDLLMKTEAPPAEIEAAADHAEAIADRLALSPGGHPLWGFAETSTSGNPRAMFEMSPISGQGNPVAAPLNLRVEGNGVAGTAVFGLAYEGPPGHVHGGHVAAAFDEVLGMVQSMSGTPGMTGTLTVRYRRPTPLYKEVRFVGRVDRREGKKIFVSSELFDGDTLCAEAEGIFIAVGSSRFQELARERGRAMGQEEG